MKTMPLQLAALACSASTLVAQPFTIEWSTIDAGGGTLTAGPFTLSGTIGQPDAAPPLSAGPFELAPGFWNGAAAAPPCPADINGDGVLDNGDIGTFISFFLNGNIAADFTGDGILDNGDIGGFIQAFLAGC